MWLLFTLNIKGDLEQMNVMMEFRPIESRKNMPEKQGVLYPSDNNENRYMGLLIVKFEKFGNNLGNSYPLM